MIYCRLQPPADAGSPLADFSTLKMKAMRSSETSVDYDLHSATYKKTTFFIVTPVKTSNITTLSLVFKYSYIDLHHNIPNIT
jgi:hypothetical protein